MTSSGAAARALAECSAGLGAWEYNAATQTVWWSDDLHRIYGTDPAAFTPNFENWLSRVLPEDREQTVRDTLAAVAHPGPFQYQFRIQHPERGVRCLQAVGRVFDDGRVVTMSGITLDVTERVNRAAEVDQLQGDLIAAIENFSDTFVAVDEHWRVTYINHRAATTVGRTCQEAIGADLWSLIPPYVGTHVEAAYRRVMSERQAERFDVLSRFSQRWMNCVVFPCGKGVAMIARDMHDMKAAEHAAAEAREQLEYIVDTMPASVFRCGRDLRYRWVNSTYATRFGLKPADFAGKTIAEMLGPEVLERLRPAIERVSSGENAQDEGELAYPKIGPRWMRWTYTPAHDAAGQIDGWIGVVTDITAHRRAQIDLLESERKYRELAQELERRVASRTQEAEQRTAQLRRLTRQLTRAEQRERKRLASHLHDHLAQLLAVAKMRLATVRSGAGPAALSELEQLLDVAIRQTRGLMNELNPAVLADLGLMPALQWLAGQFQERYGLQVTVQTELETVLMDDDSQLTLFHAVRELLMNAVKHARVAEASVAVTRHGEMLEIIVADAGSGFDPAAQPTRPSDEGGFGLTHLRERIAAIGGVMTIEAAPGSGTKITLRSPIVAPAAVADDSPAGAARRLSRRPSRKQSDGHITVLLVDDHRIVRDGLKGVIETVDDISIIGEASDGMDAVEQATTLRPQVVVMDLSMPRLNGIEATRRIKAQLPEVQVVGLSMHEGDDSADAMKAAGACEFLAKGGPVEDLITAIRNAATVK